MTKKLNLAGQSTDHIWAMQHEDLIGLRLDCGDSGTVLFSRSQAKEVIETLQYMLNNFDETCSNPSTGGY